MEIEFVTCPKCGSPMKSTAKFCGSCDYTVPEELEELRVAGSSTSSASMQPAEMSSETADVIDKAPADGKGKSSKPSFGVIGGIIAGSLIISAALVGWYYYGRPKISTTPAPVVSAPAQPQPTVSTPAVPLAGVKQESAPAQEQAKKPEPAKVVQKAKSEPKKALTANVASRMPKEKKKPEVKDTPLVSTDSTNNEKYNGPISVKPTPAVESQASHAVTDVAKWLRDNGYNVVASLKNEQIVLKGSATPSEKTRIMSKAKNYGVPVRDIIVVDLN